MLTFSGADLESSELSYLSMRDASQAIHIGGGNSGNLAVSDEKTPLLWALENGHTETVPLLLKKGANIEAKDMVWFIVWMWWRITSMNTHCMQR